MVSTNHALLGGIIAATVHEPFVAVPVAFASHFVLDVLPHFNIQVVDGDVHTRNNLPLFKVVTRTDTVLTVIALCLVPVVLHNQAWWLVTAACMLAAIAPDMAWVYRFLLERKTGTLGPKNAFNRFHKRIQWQEHDWALPVDIAWFALSIYVVLRIAS